MAVDLNYEKDSKERIPYEHYLEVYQNADPAEIFTAGVNVPYDAEKKHEFTVSLMGVLPTGFSLGRKEWRKKRVPRAASWR